jgi:hypothetical protein
VLGKPISLLKTQLFSFFWSPSVAQAVVGQQDKMPKLKKQLANP